MQYEAYGKQRYNGHSKLLEIKKIIQGFYSFYSRTPSLKISLRDTSPHISSTHA